MHTVQHCRVATLRVRYTYSNAANEWAQWRRWGNILSYRNNAISRKPEFKFEGHGLWIGFREFGKYPGNFQGSWGCPMSGVFKMILQSGKIKSWCTIFTKMILRSDPIHLLISPFSSFQGSPYVKKPAWVKTAREHTFLSCHRGI